MSKKCHLVKRDGSPCGRKASSSSAAKAARTKFTKIAKFCHNKIGGVKGKGVKTWRHAIGACVKKEFKWLREKAA
jgi:hypothetical protein